MAHELLAKSDHQLGMCLRMLYAEGIRSSIPVHSAKNEKGKMEFLVTVPVDDAQFEVLERRYQTLIGERKSRAQNSRTGIERRACTRKVQALFLLVLPGGP